ncbi:hypothetical protein XHC_4132 [Xanthomonas hortorum pv. carotae str. M081]|nr:hypothetical protein XHC_4132 [Xanthomonas hortorum pv. carotae str. M081]
MLQFGRGLHAAACRGIRWYDQARYQRVRSPWPRVERCVTRLGRDRCCSAN